MTLWAVNDYNHTYADNRLGNAPYAVKVQLSDKDMIATSVDPNVFNTTAAVSNVAPSALAVTLSPSTFFVGNSTTLTGSFTDPGTLAAASNEYPLAA